MAEKQISIDVTNLFEQIRAEVEYLGAKRLKEDPESYRRIAMIPDDAQLTGGYIKDALSAIAVALREYDAEFEAPLKITDLFGTGSYSTDGNAGAIITPGTITKPPATTMPVEPEIKPTTPTKPTDPDEPEETLYSPKQSTAASGQEINPMSDTDTDTDSGSETDTEPTDKEEAEAAVLTLKF